MPSLYNIMSNLNGEDLKTEELCYICRSKPSKGKELKEHEGMMLCMHHYTFITAKEQMLTTVYLEDVKFFRAFFGKEKRYSLLSLDQLIEIRKVQALEELVYQLNFAKDQEGTLYVRPIPDEY